MERKRICPYCMQELEEGRAQCPHCGRELAGRNPAGSLPAGTVLAGRYTVGDIQSVDGEGILYRGVENTGPFRVTMVLIKDRAFLCSERMCVSLLRDT